MKVEASCRPIASILPEINTLRSPTTSYVIVDIDGTIADVRHRLHYIQSRKRKNWPGFFASMDKDTPIENMVEYVRKLAADHRILIVTGRPERYRAPTERWLGTHGIPYQELYMRRNGDHRPDYESKAEVLRNFHRKQIVLAIDDRPPVCDMWEKNGVRCMRIQSDVQSQEVNELYREIPHRKGRSPNGANR